MKHLISALILSVLLGCSAKTNKQLADPLEVISSVAAVAIPLSCRFITKKNNFIRNNELLSILSNFTQYIE